MNPDNVKIVSGDFEGNFFTNQKSVLTADEWNSASKDHAVKVYRGELRNVKEEENYNPEVLRNRESLLLHNVTNVQLHFEIEDTGTTAARIFDFEQILLVDAIVKDSWELNGKTYGVISGRFLGKIQNRRDGINGSLTGNDFSVGRNGSNNSDFLNNQGCLSGIGKWLLWLSLIAGLVWMFKSCSNGDSMSGKCCEEIERLETDNQNLRNELDSLRIACDNAQDSLDNEQIQLELDQLTSKVYFLGGTITIRKISLEKLEEIAEILNKNPNLEVEVRGFHNSTGFTLIEGQSIDKARAEEVKRILVDKGIDERRIAALGMGESTLYPSDSYEEYYDVDGEIIQWNKNMRVEIKVVKE